MSINDYLAILLMFLTLYFITFLLGKWQSKTNLSEKVANNNESLHVFLKIKLNEKEALINSKSIFQ